MAETERAEAESERKDLEKFLATERGRAMRERAATRARDLWDQSADIA